MNAQQKTLVNANLFSRLFDGLDDPQRLAIETADGQHISYGDLIARAGQIANVLVGRGVKPGDRVAAQTEKSVTGLVLYLATVRAGAVFLPLNTAYTLNELEYFITDAEPSLVVCDPSKAAGIGPIAAKVGAKIETLGPDGKGSLTEAADKAPSVFTTVPRANDDLAAILYTSGTTGRSKGAMLTHDNLASNSLTLVDYWHFADKDVLIHAVRASCDDLPAEARSGSDHQADGAGDRADGRADLLYAAVAKPCAEQESHQTHAAVRVGLGTALGRYPSRMVCPHRSCGARTLRHDRNQHEYVEPL
jgi:acyl-coenzyme A synthetase/AMP-(fatty) acid ligase